MKTTDGSEMIEFKLGISLEKAVKQLLRFKEEGLRVSGAFNGVILYSDTVTMDSAYLAVVGMTKAEFDKRYKKIGGIV